MVFLFSGSELAFSKNVPELDFSFGTSREDLSVVGGESNGVDFRLMTNESLVGGTCSQIPESEGLVPRRGDSEAVLLREGEVGNEVVVSGEGLVGNTEEAILFLLEEFPDHDGFISRSGNKDGGVLIFLLGESGNDGSDPVGVSLEDTSLDVVNIGVGVISHFLFFFYFIFIFIYLIISQIQLDLSLLS